MTNAPPRKIFGAVPCHTQADHATVLGMGPLRPDLRKTVRDGGQTVSQVGSGHSVSASARYNVARDTLSAWAMTVTLSPLALRALAAASLSASMTDGRPPVRP